MSTNVAQQIIQFIRKKHIPTASCCSSLKNIIWGKMGKVCISHGSLFLLWILIPFCSTDTIQFFRQPGFKGYMYAGTSTGSCTNLPDYAWNCTGSVKTTGCVVVYSDIDCYRITDQEYGFVFTSENHNLTDYFSRIGSFRDCTDLERDSKIHVDATYFYPEVHVFRNVCTCMQLPYVIPEWDIMFLNTYGKCITTYSDENCLGNTWIYGDYGQTGDLVNREVASSFKPCRLPTHCVSMNAVLTQLEPSSDLSNLPYPTNGVTIGATETFRNNGGGTIEQDYLVEKDIEENFQFGFAKEFSQMNSISFDLGVKIGVKANFFSGLIKASAEIQEGLSTKYQSTSSSTETQESGIKRTTKFKVEKKIIIPPCTEYKVGSSVKVATDVAINYRVEYKITGIVQADVKMKASEIREYLGDIKYLRDVDEFTVLAETTAQMKATFGLETFADAKGTIIAPCLASRAPSMVKPEWIAMWLNFALVFTFSVVL